MEGQWLRCNDGGLLRNGTPSALPRASSGPWRVRLGEPTHRMPGRAARRTSTPGGYNMKWTKPEAEVVAVTMEVTAYVATL